MFNIFISIVEKKLAKKSDDSEQYIPMGSNKRSKSDETLERFIFCNERVHCNSGQHCTILQWNSWLGGRLRSPILLTDYPNSIYSINSIILYQKPVSYRLRAACYRGDIIGQARRGWDVYRVKNDWWILMLLLERHVDFDWGENCVWSYGSTGVCHRNFGDSRRVPREKSSKRKHRRWRQIWKLK